MQKLQPILIQRDVEKSTKTQRKYWFAECPYCGVVFSARYSDLKNGHTRSCGCITSKNKEKNRYILSQGDVFGSLKILHETKHDSRGRGYFLCECKCGNLCEVRRDLLISGNTSSCGCERFQSKGEKLIEKLLKENNIPFEKEKTFDSCRFPDSKYPARFDFYVNNSYLIEFDGQQHFKFSKSNTGWNNQKHFLKVQQRDAFKNNWCKENNIPLIRIPYTKIKSLTIKDLLI